MISVGITGNKGFIGSHVVNNLRLFKDEFKIINFEKSYFDEDSRLQSFVSECDVIIHLAAINRHDDQEFLHATNVQLTEKLLNACISTDAKPKIIFSSSTQHDKQNDYGRSKKISENLIIEWALQVHSSSSILVIPNVFGPFGKPYYNSVIGTFCYQLINNITPTIHENILVQFIYVDELVGVILNEVRNKVSTKYIKIPCTFETKIFEILTILQTFKETYFIQKNIPDLTSTFHLNLFNTFRSYIKPDHFFPIYLANNIDYRGSFIEIVKMNSGGQVSFSTTHPQIVRGNHFHKRKIERFSVIKGKALIQMRKFGSDEIFEFKVDGKNPCAVDMPAWYTHNIMNVGDEILYTIFWINEAYNANNPDTYFENV